MLHFETISGKTLDILRGIQAQKLGELRLVGGTALALHGVIETVKRYGIYITGYLALNYLLLEKCKRNKFQMMQNLGSAS